MRTSSLSIPIAVLALGLAASGAGATATAGARATARAKPAARPRAGAPASPAAPAASSSDSTMTLRGGQEGTAFRTLTVEGEDRIHYEVVRPELKLALDPQTAPGLDWGTARDVLDRTVPDGMAPLLALTSREPSVYTARPWLSHFAAGAVARFHPQVQGVERWKLTVADAGGHAVASFDGHGNPPAEIAWDGRGSGGAPVTPGATYSYVFEAVDKAGNHRHFVGDGFRVSAYRVSNDAGTWLVFNGAEMAPADARVASLATLEAPSPVILEAASWLNQLPSTMPIEIGVNARSADESSALAQRVRRQIVPLLLGDPARVGVETHVGVDAPESGAVTIICGRALPLPITSRKR